MARFLLDFASWTVNTFLALGISTLMVSAFLGADGYSPDSPEEHRQP